MNYMSSIQRRLNCMKKYFRGIDDMSSLMEYCKRNKFNVITYKGHDCIICDALPLEPIPSDLFLYGLRYSDDDFSKPATIEPYVIVNKWGYIITDNELSKYGKDEFNGGWYINLSNLEATDFVNGINFK